MNCTSHLDRIYNQLCQHEPTCLASASQQTSFQEDTAISVFLMKSSAQSHHVMSAIFTNPGSYSRPMVHMVNLQNTMMRAKGNKSCEAAQGLVTMIISLA